MRKIVLAVCLVALTTLCSKAQETESMGTYTDAQNIKYNCKRTYYGDDIDGTPQYDYSASVTESADAAGGISIPSSIYKGGIEYYVDRIESGAFRQNEKLTSVFIPYTIKSMGTLTFAGCTSLTSASIEEKPETSYYYGQLTEISNGVFMDCSSLVSVNIPEGIKKISSGAFSGCSSLSSVTIPSTVQRIEGAFNGCSSLKSIFIPASVEYIGSNGYGYNEFQDCSSLTEISVAEGNKVYDSRNNCNAIIETATNTLVTGCTNTKISSSIKTLKNQCFAGSGLSSIEIPGSAAKIGNSAFRDCKALTAVTIHNGVASIGAAAFLGCVSLAEMEIPASVNDIQGNPFSKCPALGSIVVDKENKVYDSRGDCNAIMETSTNTVLSGCRNSKIPGDAIIIGSGAFSGGDFDSFAIPEGIREIGSGAFSNCDNLTHLSIPNSVETIGTAFLQSCQKLEYIESYMTNPCILEKDAFSRYWYTYLPGQGTIINYLGRDYITTYIPKGTKEKYIANGWGYEDGDGYKSNLIEMGDNIPTAITSMPEDYEDFQYYDLNGRRLNTFHRGINIVRSKDGKLKKVVF